LRNINSDLYATKFSDPGSIVGEANVPLIITGTKQIGDNPVILKHEQHLTSDASGYIYMTPEWDSPGYNIEVNPASSSLNIIMRNPIQPMEFLANDTKTMTIYVE